MRAIWSGTVKSESRKVKATGQPMEYRLTLFDTGEGSCTCPSFIFQSLNNSNVSAEDKMRFRCKHLREAFAAHNIEPVVTEESPPAPTPEAPAVLEPTPPKPPAWGLWLDDDEPRIRRHHD